ncbi:MAG TPA: cupin domain-containing protein [Acidimicrobiia bacterium]|nr:cupin domain-containing protein [Acidimicrobiia bacterium]
MTGPSTRRARALAAAVIGVLAVGGLALGTANAADKQEPIRRTIWGQAEPQNAPGQTMYLQQVVIDPGAKLPEHFHEGTQLSTIRAGVLTYQVVSGSVAVTRADGTTETVTGPGMVKLRKGDSIVEPESLVHFGANNGTSPVVIEIVALLHDGAPLSTAVGAQPGSTAIHVETTLTSESRALAQVGPGAASTYGTNHLLGTATVDGQTVTVDMQANVQYTNGSGPFFGFVTFTYPDGSTIAVSMQGQAAATAGSDDTTFAATLGVIGGTGTFVDATGSGTFTGTRQSALGGQVSAVFDLQLLKGPQ